MLERILLLTTAIMLLLISTAFAQQSGPKRTILRTISILPAIPLSPSRLNLRREVAQVSTPIQVSIAATYWKAIFF